MDASHRADRNWGATKGRRSVTYHYIGPIELPNLFLPVYSDRTDEIIGFEAVNYTARFDENIRHVKEAKSSK